VGSCTEALIYRAPHQLRSRRGWGTQVERSRTLSTVRVRAHRGAPSPQHTWCSFNSGTDDRCHM